MSTIFNEIIKLKTTICEKEVSISTWFQTNDNTFDRVYMDHSVKHRVLRKTQP